MQVTLTNRELLGLFEAAKQVAGTKMGLKLAYAMAKNLKRIDGDCLALTEQTEKERMAIIDDLAMRDADGKPIIENDQYQFTDENRRACEERLVGLQKETEDLLSTGVSVDLHRVKLDQFPEQIEPMVLMALFPMMDDSADE